MRRERPLVTAEEKRRWKRERRLIRARLINAARIARAVRAAARKGGEDEHQ